MRPCQGRDGSSILPTRTKVMEDKLIHCRDLETGQYVEVPQKSLVFRPAVFGIIIKEENILLVPTRHGYSLPGGAIENGESFEDALEREVYEETGLQAKISQLLTTSQDFYVSVNDRKAYQSIIFIFLCKELTGEVSTAQFSEYEQKYYKKAEWIPFSNEEKIVNAYPHGISELLKNI